MNSVIKLTQIWKNNNKRLDWNEYFMSIAFLSSSRSPCERLHVGCVLVKDTRIVTIGYNGFLPQAPHKSRVINNHEMAIVHAEQNAITDAASRGTSVNDTIAYITHYPCINCAKILAAAGIKKIFYALDYKNDSLVETLLTPLKIEINQLD